MNPEVVGKQLENFSFGYEPRYDEEGERLFGSISECEAMRKLDQACRAEHGDDTCPVIINISSDATHVNRTGTTKAHPVLVTCGNLNRETLMRPLAYELVGYVPVLPISDPLVFQHLGKGCVLTKTNQKLACRMTKKYFHQDYMTEIIAPVKELKEPVALCIGSTISPGCTHRIIKARFYIRLYVCKCYIHK